MRGRPRQVTDFLFPQGEEGGEPSCDRCRREPSFSMSMSTEVSVEFLEDTVVDEKCSERGIPSIFMGIPGDSGGFGACKG